MEKVSGNDTVLQTGT